MDINDHLANIKKQRKKAKSLFILRAMWRSGLLYHDCKKNKVYYKQPAPFDWYCKKCGEPW